MSSELKIFSNDEVLEFYKNISKNVRNLRELKKISQLEMALSIDIKSVAFYSNCENNRYGKHFNLEHIYKISKVLDVPIAEILNQ